MRLSKPTLKALVAIAAFPLLLVSSKVITTDYYHRAEAVLDESQLEAEATVAAIEACAASLDDLFQSSEGEDSLLDSISFVVHRNGEAEPCGSTQISSQAIHNALSTMDKCHTDFDKFDLESFMTRVLAETLSEGSCSSTEDDELPPGLLGHCDMGEDYTPILLDHEQLVRVPEGTLPCRFHTREGLRIASLEQLADLSRKAQTCSIEDGQEVCAQSVEVHLYAVPAGRVFIFAPAYVGEIFQLPHVDVDSGLPVYLEVLSLSPRVFDIFNFFDKSESDKLVAKALAETSPSHRIKRSTTGTKENSVISTRTSENGFDTHGETALKVKRRCMTVLGFDEYLEGHTDGLQILRYNTTAAYTSHMDYMTDRTGTEFFDYDSAHKGGNRFATILLYMSDLAEGEGGETVFSEAWPPGLPEEERVQLPEALTALRASGDAGVLKEGSWEEKMVAQCRTRLAVRPNSARAVLFYSQHPNGEQDYDSLHGGCPVLKGEKWAANLWVWNTPREGFTGSPVKAKFAGESESVTSQRPNQLSATFRNTGQNPAFKVADLYYDESGYWGKIGHGEPPLNVNTFKGHKWNVKVDGKVVHSWVIGDDLKQEFLL